MSTEEKFNQAKGSVKEGLGKITGDKKTEKEGAAERFLEIQGFAGGHRSVE